MSNTQPDKTKPIRILILGGGFGGVAAAQILESQLRSRPDVEITLVSRENYSLFTPMLHAVASGEIEPSSIANPLRNLIKRVTTLQANVDSIDLANKLVEISHSAELRHRELTYDYLILGVGSESNFFNLPGVAERASTLKSLGDAVLLRNRVIAILEAASVEEDETQRKAMLTFVIAGGGFTGVEAIGALTDLVHESLPRYPRLAKESPRFVLVHGASTILPELGEALGTFAAEQLIKRGVEVRLNTRVTASTDTVVECDDGKPIEAKTLVWTTGVTPSTLFKNTQLPTEKGRIVVNNILEVPGYPGVWAVGDCASVPDPATNKACPPTAQHALRQGTIAGKNVAAKILNAQPVAFEYKALGQLAAIGRHAGVARILGFNFSGVFAFVLWRAIYLMKLPRIAKKSRVLGAWLTNLVFPLDLVQLVTVRDMEAMAKVLEQLRKDLPKR